MQSCSYFVKQIKTKMNYLQLPRTWCQKAARGWRFRCCDCNDGCTSPELCIQLQLVPGTALIPFSNTCFMCCRWHFWDRLHILIFFIFKQQYGGWGQNTWGQYAQYNQYNQYYPPPPTWWRQISRWRLRGKHLFLSDTEQDFTAGSHGDFSPTTDPNLFLLIFSVTSVKFGSNSLK